jgi:hypothetical protein
VGREGSPSDRHQDLSCLFPTEGLQQIQNLAREASLFPERHFPKHPRPFLGQLSADERRALVEFVRSLYGAPQENSGQ